MTLKISEQTQIGYQMKDEQTDKYDLTKKYLEYFLQPLLNFKKKEDYGEEFFQYLFHNRTEEKDRIRNAIVNRNNVTVAGNPGQGKTCLMHSLFIELSERSDFYPIILDYREAFPRNYKGILIKFVSEMRKFFNVIGKPLTTIIDKTNINNVDAHMIDVTNHLSEIKLKNISKDLVIFLDDLDYAEEEYYYILKNLFINYAASEKCVIVLSVRKPLLDVISKDDQLLQCYRIQPQQVELCNVDLRVLLHNRLKTILDLKEEESFLAKIIKIFRKKTLDDLLIQASKIEGEIEKIEELPFSRCFYIQLNELTYGNLRTIESILPELLIYRIKNNKPCINDDFANAFISITHKHKDILLDLITDKTRSNRKRHNGNSILQIVLEYFFSNEVKDLLFYEEMASYGIDKYTADKALLKLVSSPYSLIDPQSIYNLMSHEVLERYCINNKGRQYINVIIPNELYYTVLNETPSERSYRFEKGI